MPTKDETRISELEDTNAKLSESLKRCRALVADFHSRLAANSNEKLAEDTALRVDKTQSD